jgi:hypothetical protein
MKQQRTKGRANVYNKTAAFRLKKVELLQIDMLAAQQETNRSEIVRKAINNYFQTAN